MGREKQPRTLADILLGLEQKIEEARKENAQANATIQNEPDVTLASLDQDAGYFKLAIYGLGAALAAIFIIGWQLFLHLDDKIDHKMDYLNGRIDGLFLLQSRNAVVTPSGTLAATPAEAPAVPTTTNSTKPPTDDANPVPAKINRRGASH